MFTGGFDINSSFVHTLGMLDPYTVFAFILGAVIAIPVIPALRKKCIDKGFAEQYTVAVTVGCLLLFVFCLAALSGAAYNPFIYFRF